MAAKIQLPIGKKFGRLLLAGSFAAIATGVFFIILLVLPLVVFEGDFLNGSVAITWYSLENYGEPVYHSGLASIQFLSIPTFSAAFFSILTGLLTFFKVFKSKRVSHIIVELSIGALEACVVFTGSLYSLVLNVIHTISILPTQVGGTGSAGLLVIQGSVRREILTSILIRQFYPLAFINIVLLVLATIIGYETARALEAAS